MVLVHRGGGFAPWSGHTQESTSECISKWNNSSVSLSPNPKLLPLSLKSAKLKRKSEGCQLLSTEQEKLLQFVLFVITIISVNKLIYLHSLYCYFNLNSLRCSLENYLCKSGCILYVTSRILACACTVCSCIELHCVQLN